MLTLKQTKKNLLFFGVRRTIRCLHYDIVRTFVQSTPLTAFIGSV